MLVSRDVISDEAWAVLGPLFPAVKATGRPPVDRRTVVEATAWRFRTGAQKFGDEPADHAIGRSRGGVDDQDAPGRRRQGAGAGVRPGRPIDFGDEQRQRYRGRNVVERCFNKLKQWRGLAMRSDKTARNHHSGQCLAATLHWVQTFGNTA